ncbi:thiamine pyrophosphate-dependent enzyme [Chloroflexota bacterium]
MIDQYEMMAVLEKHRGDAIVFSAMSASNAWLETSHWKERDVPVTGSMGKASSLALGLALAQPDTKIIVLDGDGSLLANLGTLATISGKHPENLYHFVMENGVYAITGGQPIPAQGLLSFAGMAKEAGYAATYEFDNLEDFTVRVEEILKQKGPVFVTIKAVPEIQNEPIPRRRRSAEMRTMAHALVDLRRALGTS